jgi:hypothetical protein
MAKRGIRKKEDERLDDATVGRVISLMESGEISTKKAACEYLNISYNTTRLNRILEEYKDKLEFRKKRFQQNKGQPFTELEIENMVVDYLCGDSMTQIANSLYRSVHVVRKKLKELHLPERNKKTTYWNADMIPDEAVSKIFEPGELVWAARYGAVAEIRKVKWAKNMSDDNIYSIFVFGKHNEFAYQPWWELGKLEVVKRFKLPVEKFVKYEKPNFGYRIE